MEKVNFLKLTKAFIYSTRSGKYSNILPRSTVFNGLIVIKLKRDLKYRLHVSFERVALYIFYQGLPYLKSHNKFYAEGEIESVTQKIISEKTEMNESINDKELQLLQLKIP